ncbi:DUF3078 domain-containing protein [Sphingobacterium sp. DN00404]|uniref:DUF3078 domain-containing protein n=1 Tax=Sphingobacterium micropteri TaxID=2763501 RepID=A0ABR7YPY8_9SPHI|nr:DUF3078 domain-containing protein [Sphingobacterium micropteri]MBD1433281.1 DUF3078 domain-containing protein [Sphingobacterium micropteri]
MFKSINFLFVILLLVVGQQGMAQVDLKELRAKPDTNIVEKPQAPATNLQEVMVPIPQLDLEVNYWKHWTKFGLNVNQSMFSDSWAQGGVSSIALTALANHKSEYTKNKFSYLTEIDLQYGRIQNDFLNDEVVTLSKKNVDRIFWDNKISYKITPRWSLFTSITFESQFDKGYTYAKDEDGNEFVSGTKSNFMAPARLTESFGLEYAPDKTFSLMFGTGTARQTFVLDENVDETAYDLEEGRKMKNVLAFQLRAKLDRNLSENFNVKSEYVMTADYKKIDDPSHRLDLILAAKVTRLVQVSLRGTLVYDADFIDAKRGKTKPEIQLSQALALGLTYTLPR